MSGETQINNLAFYVNGEQVAYEPDSLTWKDGLGVSNVRNVVVGGGVTQQIFSEDIKTKFGTVMVALPTTVTNIKNTRAWKVNKNQNTLEIMGTIDGVTLSRIFTNASIGDEPENKTATEGTIDLEWKSNPAQ